MLLNSDDKSKKIKEIFDMIVQKTNGFKFIKCNNKTEKENTLVEDLVEKSVEIRKICSTANPVIITKKHFLTLENDTFNSTNPPNLYNRFLTFCWHNKYTKNDKDFIPESIIIEENLNIKKPDRLELQKKAIKKKVLKQTGNKLTYFSDDIKSLEDILESEYEQV